MTVLYLVRHGQTAWNEQRRYLGWTDQPLDEMGLRQAEHLLAYVEGLEVAAVFSSDLQRALSTAEEAAKRHGRKVIIDPRLREINFGVLEGLTFAAAQERYAQRLQAWLNDVEQTLPDAEAYADFAARIASFLAEVRRAYAHAAVLVITHGGPIREILRQAFGLPRQGIWYFQVDLASVSELAFYETGPVLKRLNAQVNLGKGT